VQKEKQECRFRYGLHDGGYLFLHGKSDAQSYSVHEKMVVHYKSRCSYFPLLSFAMKKAAEIRLNTAADFL